MTEPTTRDAAFHRAGVTASRVRGWSRRLTAVLATGLFLVGPWPVDDTSYVGSEYQRRTLDRLDASPTPGPAGPIRVGVAEVDLTPESPRPLAGFIGQISTPFVGVDTRCFGRALTIASGSEVVTILTADLLLINSKLARAVVDRAGLRPDQVFFTASHTHGGPGGWGEHPLEMLTAGAYDPAFFETLAVRLAESVRLSRATTVPAEVGFVETPTVGRQKNRVDPALPTHDALSALVFRALDAPTEAAPLAILAVFGAHATVSHPVPPRLGGDYPAALATELKRRSGAGVVLFAAGAVGDASPARPRASSPARSAEALGSALAGDLMAILPSAKFGRDVVLGNLRLDVDLPVIRLPAFTAQLRFSPVATWWIADRRTHLHALRIGPAVLVGFPGDYAGHLADRLDTSNRGAGVSTVSTSFNGDYRGYLVSGSVFRRRSCYETRWMSFYGPWAGEYLNDLGRRMVERLATGSSRLNRPLSASADLAPRLAMAMLLAGALAGAWRGRQVFAVRFRLVSVAIATAAVLAFLADPEWIEWSRVGLPSWVRLAGFPMGLVALTSAGRPRPGVAAILFGFSCSLLTASCVIPLMLLRAWASSPPGGLAGNRQ